MARGQQPTSGDESVNPGFGVPGRNAADNPVTRNYADEAFVDDFVDQDNTVVDLMAPNVDQLFVRERMDDEAARGYFREFQNKDGMVAVEVGGVVREVPSGQIAYEAFMHEPVVIRIHSSRDPNDPPLVFVGDNGDIRWLPREKNVKIPRKFVERLAAAQEVRYEQTENPDPRSDDMKLTTKKIASSYSFSVINDPSPYGRRWLRRIARERT